MMPVARYPLRPLSPFREISGGRQEAGQAGMLRGFQARRRLSPEVAYPEAQKDATLPDWGSRDLKIGTLRAAIRQLGIDWSEFQAS